jgi:hypothetical protein
MLLKQYLDEIDPTTIPSRLDYIRDKDECIKVPPQIRNARGRPKGDRKRGVLERIMDNRPRKRKQRTCTTCNRIGHTSKGCSKWTAKLGNIINGSVDDLGLPAPADTLERLINPDLDNDDVCFFDDDDDADKKGKKRSREDDNDDDQGDRVKIAKTDETQEIFRGFLLHAPVDDENYHDDDRDDFILEEEEEEENNNDFVVDDDDDDDFM